MNEGLLNKISREVRVKNPPAGFPTKVVAIDGHGGAGKSTVAAMLAKALNAEILHTDDFASWDNPTDWWPLLIKEVFEPIKSGAKLLNYRRSKWSEDHNPEQVRNQPVTSIMVLEGVSSARKEFRPYLTYAIWVETPRELCLKRGLERDGSNARPQWEKWLAEEDEYIKRDNPASYADIKVSGSDDENSE